MSQKLVDTAIEVIKASPPIAVLSVAKQGLTLQEWVWIATLVYIGLQAGWLLWRWYRQANSTNNWGD